MQIAAPQITPQLKALPGTNNGEDELEDSVLEEPKIEDAGLQDQTLPEEAQADLLELCNGDEKLAIFYTHWLANGLNATKAYQAIHPNVPYRSAKTLGSKVLSKIDRKLIAAAYGLDHKTYFAQLREGLKATKYVDDGEEMTLVPDHSVRRPYHAVLGQIVDAEVPGRSGVAVQVNVGKDVADWGTGAFKEVQQ